MKRETFQGLKDQLDELTRRIDDVDVEFWFARELMTVLGYSRWENFLVALHRAITSCESTGYNPDDHFRGVTKMIPLAKGAQRPIDDFMLTRYACYLIAQNGDPRKEEIAFAQGYFAVQTRKIELIEDCITKRRPHPPAPSPAFGRRRGAKANAAYLVSPADH